MFTCEGSTYRVMLLWIPGTHVSNNSTPNGVCPCNCAAVTHREICNNLKASWALIQYKDCLLGYKDSHYKGKMDMRQSYLHNGNLTLVTQCLYTEMTPRMFTAAKHCFIGIALQVKTIGEIEPWIYFHFDPWSESTWSCESYCVWPRLRRIRDLEWG